MNRTSLLCSLATIAVAGGAVAFYAPDASANVSVACEPPSTAVVTLTGWTAGDQVDTTLLADGNVIAARDVAALGGEPQSYTVALDRAAGLVATARRHGEPGTQRLYTSGAPVQCGTEPSPLPAPPVSVPPESQPPTVARITCAELVARHAGVRWFRELGCTPPKPRKVTCRWLRAHHAGPRSYTRLGHYPGCRGPRQIVPRRPVAVTG